MVERDSLLDAWDEMFNAAQRVETALPQQMSEAIANLEAARKNMRTVLQSWATTSEADLQRQLSEAVERAERAERERDEALTEIERHDAEAANMMLAHIKRAEAAEAERDRFRRGLETLACTFYKDDQYQDYAKHVLDAALRASHQQGEPKP